MKAQGGRRILYEYFEEDYNKVTVRDPRLYRGSGPFQEDAGEPAARGAIGAVFTTDVLSYYFEGAPGVGASGVLDVDRRHDKVALRRHEELAGLMS